MAQPSDRFAEQLLDLGFRVAGNDRRGVIQYARHRNRYLTQWVHDDGEMALFTWEYELGEWCAALGWQIGAAETSMQILYPQYDARLTREGAAVADEITRLEARLSHLDLSAPEL